MSDRILLVEDDPAILRGLRDNLRGEAYEVLTATDGEAAYAAIREHRPDLVVLDVMLPRLSGIEVCRRIRSEGVTTPVLMLTAQGDEQDRVTGLDSGADDYVTKPFLLKELLARIRGLLRHRRHWSAEREQLDRDVRGAADVQQRLLPGRPPSLGTLDCAGFCEPARAVGGDYYDFIDLTHGRVAIVLADVAGKGITAALTMASLHGMIRTEAPHFGSDCTALVQALNSALHVTVAPGRFVTLFYAVYDDTSRRLTYVNAGHPAPLLVRAGVESLAASTPPLGLFEAIAPVPATIALAPGEWLLAFSDGVSEAMGAGGVEFSGERLVEILARRRPADAAAMCATARDAIREHTCGRPAADDITVVALRAV